MTAAEIIALVAESFGLPARSLTGSSQTRQITRPRFLAMALVRDVLDYSTPQIGRVFGGRDHTTVLHAIKRAAELVADDPAIAAKVETLRGLIDLRLAPQIPTDPRQARVAADAIARAVRHTVLRSAEADPEAFLRGAATLLAGAKGRAA